MVGGAGWGAGDARKKERKKTSMGVGRGSWKGLKADAPPPGYQGDAIEGRTTGGGGGGTPRCGTRHGGASRGEGDGWGGMIGGRVALLGLAAPGGGAKLALARGGSLASSRRWGGVDRWGGGGGGGALTGG